MSESLSPTFVAEFVDGEVTRMTTFSPLKKLDVERGVRLARYAYLSRKRGKAPPPIVKAHFESNGQMLEAYSAVDLEDIDSPTSIAPKDTDEGDGEVVERVQEQDEHRHQEEMSKAYLDEDNNPIAASTEDDNEKVERIREQRDGANADVMPEGPCEERE